MRLETKRLLIRRWRMEDAEALFLLASEKDVALNAGFRPHASLKDSRELLRDHLREADSYAVTLKSGTLIGCINLLEKENGVFSVGYWLGKPYWGRGYMPEGLLAVIEDVFFKRACRVLCGDFYEGNTRSRRCLEKCGFSHERPCQMRPAMGGKRIRGRMLQITKEEYKAIEL